MKRPYSKWTNLYERFWPFSLGSLEKINMIEKSHDQTRQSFFVKSLSFISFFFSFLKAHSKYERNQKYYIRQL